MRSFGANFVAEQTARHARSFLTATFHFPDPRGDIYVSSRAVTIDGNLHHSIIPADGWGEFREIVDPRENRVAIDETTLTFTNLPIPTLDGERFASLLGSYPEDVEVDVYWTFQRPDNSFVQELISTYVVQGPSGWSWNRGQVILRTLWEKYLNQPVLRRYDSGCRAGDVRKLVIGRVPFVPGDLIAGDSAIEGSLSSIEYSDETDVTDAVTITNERLRRDRFDATSEAAEFDTTDYQNYITADASATFKLNNDATTAGQFRIEKAQRSGGSYVTFSDLSDGEAGGGYLLIHGVAIPVRVLAARATRAVLESVRLQISRDRDDFGVSALQIELWDHVPAFSKTAQWTSGALVPRYTYHVVATSRTGQGGLIWSNQQLEYKLPADDAAAGQQTLTDGNINLGIGVEIETNRTYFLVIYDQEPSSDQSGYRVWGRAESAYADTDPGSYVTTSENPVADGTILRFESSGGAPEFDDGYAARQLPFSPWMEVNASTVNDFSEVQSTGGTFVDRFTTLKARMINKIYVQMQRNRPDTRVEVTVRLEKALRTGGSSGTIFETSFSAENVIYDPSSGTPVEFITENLEEPIIMDAGTYDFIVTATWYAADRVDPATGAIIGVQDDYVLVGASTDPDASGVSVVGNKLLFASRELIASSTRINFRLGAMDYNEILNHLLGIDPNNPPTPTPDDEDPEADGMCPAVRFRATVTNTTTGANPSFGTVANYLLTRAGVPPARIDTAGSFAAVDAQLAGYVFNGVIDSQTTYKELFAELQAEARGYLDWDGSKFVLRYVETTPKASADKTITLADLVGVDGAPAFTIERGNPIDVVNRVTIRYGRIAQPDPDQHEWPLAVTHEDAASQVKFLVKEKVIDGQFIRTKQHADLLAQYILERFAFPPEIATMTTKRQLIEVERNDHLVLNGV